MLLLLDKAQKVIENKQKIIDDQNSRINMLEKEIIELRSEKNKDLRSPQIRMKILY